MSYLFLILSDVGICSFADAITWLVENHSRNSDNNGKIVILWIECNYSDNCHLLISGNKHEQMWLKIGNPPIWGSLTLVIF